MNDPYSILGVSPDASMDEVKKAYRELARKYHPDNYHDNPLSDLAQEKMKEINDAYNTIVKAREGGGGGHHHWGGGAHRGGGYTGPSGSGNSPESAKIRAAINSGDLRLAEELLNAYTARDAEWYFLMGSVCYRKGWLDEAMRHYQTAVSMDPNNTEYRQALAYMQQGGQAYNPFGGNRQGDGGCDACDCCAAMMCMNLCCRCS